MTMLTLKRKPTTKMKTNTQEKALVMYKKIDSLDKKYRPIILDWLNSLFKPETPYSHSFADQWINWTIWDGELSIRFDLRNEAQKELLSAIHPRFLGCPQIGTLKVVNENSFYLSLKSLLHIEYPEIIGSKLLIRHKERGGKGGWHSPSDDFYTYDWCVSLADGSDIFYHNQEPEMDMVKGGFKYNASIQERAFIRFLDKLKQETNG